MTHAYFCSLVSQHHQFLAQELWILWKKLVTLPLYVYMDEILFQQSSPFRRCADLPGALHINRDATIFAWRYHNDVVVRCWCYCLWNRDLACYYTTGKVFKEIIWFEVHSIGWPLEGVGQCHVHLVSDCGLAQGNFTDRSIVMSKCCSHSNPRIKLV